jgi:CO/xanthine dehydrogenase Mo-binding subunit
MARLAITTHATIAFWNGGRLSVLDSTQSVYTTARSLALIFKIDPDDVQVVAPFVGGGFGGKGGLWNHTPLCAAARQSVEASGEAIFIARRSLSGSWRTYGRGTADRSRR